MARLLSIESWKRWLWSFVRLVLIAGLSFVILYPIIQKISTAIKAKTDLYSPIVVWIPEHYSFENVMNAISIMDYWKTLLNTFTLSATTTILTAISCALAGYAFARLKFKGSNLLFARCYSDHYGTANDDTYSDVSESERLQSDGLDPAYYGEICESVEFLLAVYLNIHHGKFLESRIIYLHIPAVLPGNSEGG